MTTSDSENTILIPQTEDYGMSTFRTRKETGYTWRRIFVFVLQIVPSIPIAAWILFFAPFSDSNDGKEEEKGNPTRNILVFTWIAAVMFAYEIKLIWVIERQFMLMEVCFVLPIAFPVLIGYMSMCALKNSNVIGVLDLIAGVLVVVGIWLNTWPEIMRSKWKKRERPSWKMLS